MSLSRPCCSSRSIIHPPHQSHPVVMATTTQQTAQIFRVRRVVEEKPRSRVSTKCINIVLLLVCFGLGPATDDKHFCDCLWVLLNTDTQQSTADIDVLNNFYQNLRQQKKTCLMLGHKEDPWDF